MKKLVSILLCMFVFCIITGCGCEKDKIKNTVNIKLDNMTIKNITIKTKDDKSTVTTKIVNDADKKTFVKKIRISFYDKNSNLKFVITKDVNKEIGSKEAMDIVHETQANFDDIDISKTQYELMKE